MDKGLRELLERKGFRQFLIKTVIFVDLFILIQALIIPLQKIKLPGGFYPVLDTDLGKAFLFMIFAFIFLTRERLANLKEYKVKLISIFLFSILSFLSLVLYFYFKKFVAGNPDFVLKYLVLFVSLKYIIIVLLFIFLVFAVFGLGFFRDIIREFKKQLVLVFLITVFGFAIILYAQFAWEIAGGVVTAIVYFMLQLTSNTAIRPAPYTLGINKFTAGIGRACAGLDSMTLFAMLFVLILFFDWKKLNKKRMAAIFLPGLVLVFFVNILRVYSLFLVGGYISRDFAVGMFHTNVGWVFFIVFFVIFWYFAYPWCKKK